MDYNNIVKKQLILKERRSYDSKGIKKKNRNE